MDKNPEKEEKRKRLLLVYYIRNKIDPTRFRGVNI